MNMRLVLGDRVYIAYLDDSRQDKTSARFQVIGAAMVEDMSFHALEQELGYSLYELVEPHVTGKFEEFHAADVLAGNPPFEKITRSHALQIFADGIKTVEDLSIKIVYGAVDLNKLYASNFATTNPIDMAFRICVKQIEAWFREHRPANAALLISDDGDKNVKNSMLNSFHVLRRPVRSSPPVRGELSHLHDDMYFGASKFSKGIQLADLCTLLIGRHLVYSDTEDLYQELSKSIIASMIEPT